MITYTGREVFPSWTNQGDVSTDVGPSVEDIAVGLGRQSRFAGQTREFYTVICHSLVTAEVADKFYPGNDALRRYMLLHDAHEAIIGDVPTTWKRPSTKEDEADLDRRIAEDLGVEKLSEEDFALFKMIDYAALAAEAHALGHSQAEKWWPIGDFGAFEAVAFDLTMMQLQVGNPTRFLIPENAIAAYKRALK